MQALIMSVVLAMIAAYTLKWTLARTGTVSSMNRTIDMQSLAEACSAQVYSMYSGTSTIPSNGSCNIDGVTVNYTVTTTSVNPPEYTINYKVATDLAGALRSGTTQNYLSY